MIRRGAIAVGFALHAVAGLLTAAAHYDGVLGATPPEGFPGPGEPPVQVTARLVVDGTPDAARDLLRALARTGALPLDLSQAPPEGSLVPARLEAEPRDAVVLLYLADAAPDVGATLVVHGEAQTFLAAAATGGEAAPAQSVALLRSTDHREPLVFKRI